VFVDGRNYGGASPGLTRHPVLRSLVRASLGARLDMVPDALVVPLGKAARDALTFLADDGLVDPARCLKGLPHPSGTNGWRVRLYTAQRRALASQIARWAASALPGRRGDDPVPGLSAAPPPSSLPEPAPGAAPQPGNIPASDRPRIAIRLTAGNLNHGYVSLARHLDLFPAAAIGPASSKDGTGTLLTLRFAGIPGITQAPLTPAIPGHTAHSRTEDNPSPPAENSARTQRSLSPAIQQHDPGRQRGVLPMTSGRSFTCCLLRRAKESVSRDWTRTPLRARITGPLVTYATPGTGQRQRSG
jgi:hypothetical protein